MKPLLIFILPRCHIQPSKMYIKIACLQLSQSHAKNKSGGEGAAVRTLLIGQIGSSIARPPSPSPTMKCGSSPSYSSLPPKRGSPSLVILHYIYSTIVCMLHIIRLKNCLHKINVNQVITNLFESFMIRVESLLSISIVKSFLSNKRHRIK